METRALARCAACLRCALLVLCLPAAALADGPLSLLNALWTPAQLVGARSEKQATLRATPDDSAPPRRAPLSPVLTPHVDAPGAVRRVDTTAPTVALTFDLCELATKVAGYDADLVATLRRENVRATFFAGGKWMRSHPERTLQLMADPRFEIGNHAWTHGNFGVLGPEAAREQLLWTQGQYELLREELTRRVRASRRVKFTGLDVEAALAAIPLQPRLFRFPYGRCKPEALALLRAHGLLGVEWDVAAEDDALTAEQAAAKALAKIRPGAIVLMHANGVPKHTDEIVRLLIQALRAKGYAFLTIAELLSRGRIEAPLECYDETPGDTHQFDAIYGDGTRRIN